MLTCNSRKRRQIRSFIDDEVLVMSTMAKLKNHFSDEYGINGEDLPTAEVSNSMTKAVKGFKQYCEEIYNRIVDDDRRTLEEIIAAVRKLDLIGVKTSDPILMGGLTSDLKEKINKESVAKVQLGRVKRAVRVNDNITEATLSAWEETRTKLDELGPEIDALELDRTSFEDLKTRIANHDQSEPKINQEIQNRKSIAKIIQILNGSVVEYEKEMQSVMLRASEDALNSIYVYEQWEITQEEGTILPIKDGVRLNLSKVSEQGGPSSGQARTIALCIMVERYLKTNCNVPLILDDAYKDISEEDDIGANLQTEAERATLHRAVNNNRQVIWANVKNPLSSPAVIARITTKELANGEAARMSAPWNNEPVVGILTTGGGI